MMRMPGMVMTMARMVMTHICFRRRNREQRENVLGELVLTEREYARDLKLTWQVMIMIRMMLMIMIMMRMRMMIKVMMMGEKMSKADMSGTVLVDIILMTTLVMTT